MPNIKIPLDPRQSEIMRQHVVLLREAQKRISEIGYFERMAREQKDIIMSLALVAASGNKEVVHGVSQLQIPVDWDCSALEFTKPEIAGVTADKQTGDEIARLKERK